MVHFGHCDKCDVEVNSMKLIHTEYRSEKVGCTINALLCEECFLQEQSPKPYKDRNRNRNRPVLVSIYLFIKRTGSILSLSKRKGKGKESNE
jgi:hypothetical protein